MTNGSTEDHRETWRYRIGLRFFRSALSGFLAGGLFRVEGADHVPADGALILAVNHPSNLDPPLFSFFPGTVHFMAKRELFVNRAVAWCLAGWNVFPVDRDALDLGALRGALRILERGGRLVLFVEGTLSIEAGMRQARPGVGFLVRHSGARVLPCAITGTDRVLPEGGRRPRRAPVTFSIGRPIDAGALSGGGSQAIADRVGAEIAKLLPHEYRGFYAPGP